MKAALLPRTSMPTFIRSVTLTTLALAGLVAGATLVQRHEAASATPDIESTAPTTAAPDALGSAAEPRSPEINAVDVALPMQSEATQPYGTPHAPFPAYEAVAQVGPDTVVRAVLVNSTGAPVRITLANPSGKAYGTLRPEGTCKAFEGASGQALPDRGTCTYRFSPLAGEIYEVYGTADKAGKDVRGHAVLKAVPQAPSTPG